MERDRVLKTKDEMGWVFREYGNFSKII